MQKLLCLALVIFGSISAFGQTCPGAEDDAALAMLTKAGPSLFLCGFEDHETNSPNGQRTFGDFTVYINTPKLKAPEVVYTSEIGSLFWVKPEDNGMEMTELWFFSDDPVPAIVSHLVCEAETCKVTAAKCILDLKKNPYPKALPKYLKDIKNIGNEGEDLLDQIFAQALAGDKAALKFYQKAPKGMDTRLTDVYESDQHKLKVAHQLKCQLPK